jgi:hypothetical protein
MDEEELRGEHSVDEEELRGEHSVLQSNIRKTSKLSTQLYTI